MKIKVNDTVWFDYKGTVTTGVVKDLSETYVTVYVQSHTGKAKTTLDVRVSKCFPTKEELVKAMKEEEDRRVSSFKEQITSVEDLVEFMFNHVVCWAEEYTDWDARRAARERAKELLNINLDAER